MRSWSLLPASVVLVLGGCGSGPPEQVQARQEAGIHQIAQQAVALPGVTCARGALNTEGLPDAPLGSLAVDLTFEPDLDRPARLAVFEQVGRAVWESDLVVFRLVVQEQSGLGLDDAIATELGSPEADDLERAFGPKPPRPTPLPELADPGNPDC